MSCSVFCHVGFIELSQSERSLRLCSLGPISRTGAAHKCSGEMHFVIARRDCRACGTRSPQDEHDLTTQEPNYKSRIPRAEFAIRFCSRQPTARRCVTDMCRTP